MRKKLAAVDSSGASGSSVVPCRDGKTSGLMLTVAMSAARVTAQNPFCGWGSCQSAGGCQLTGASARNRANACSRSANGSAQNPRDEMSIPVLTGWSVTKSSIPVAPPWARGHRGRRRPATP